MNSHGRKALVELGAGMEPIRSHVMIRQVDRLAGDLREQMATVVAQVQSMFRQTDCVPINRVCLTGAGDSRYACCATALAFESIANVDCEQISPEQLTDYGARWMRHGAPNGTLLIAASASGSTKVVVQAIEEARKQGAVTVILTGNPASAAVRAAHFSIVIELQQQERSPGIRTYQSSVLGLLVLAIQLAEFNKAIAPCSAMALRGELIGLADSIESTNIQIKEPSRKVADLIAEAAGALFVGSGPNFGTARFGAAKVVEASGKLAFGQDLEGWWHVERFACPMDLPLFVIAAPGQSHSRAVEVVAAARELGRRVIAVSHLDDADVSRHVDVRLPVYGQVREEFSPLLYHLFASHVAASVGELMGRSPFQSNPENFVKPTS
jgi:glutamine---fructose-6-phosphate transaminase (isomerizing)